MSASSPPREETFPKLSEERRGRIAAFAGWRRFADGELLWEQGDCNRPLFVVLEGGGNSHAPHAHADRGPRGHGQDLTRGHLDEAKWPLARPPLLFETSRPGVFAVGDVRASSVKRVAAAVGEGSVNTHGR